jgi:hypothetical protein
MLQNCHLMQSWVPKLERLLEVVQENAHPDFRCFISAEPPPLSSWKNMPESLMQGSVKVRVYCELLRAVVVVVLLHARSWSCCARLPSIVFSDQDRACYVVVHYVVAVQPF